MTTPFCTTHDWCREHDHGFGGAKEPATAHAGLTVTLPTPPHMEPGEDDPPHLLEVQVWADDKDYTVPRAYLEHDDSGEELSMDVDQLGEFIAQLGAFRDQLVAVHEQLQQTKAVSS